ncbi:2346_t:CDS:2, partial [Diversispora eburnea]
MEQQVSEGFEDPQKRISVKRSKDVQERINEERRMAVVTTKEILQANIFSPLFNARQNNVTFDIPPPISEPLMEAKDAMDAMEE